MAAAAAAACVREWVGGVVGAVGAVGRWQVAGGRWQAAGGSGTRASASPQPLSLVSTRHDSSSPPVGIMISCFIHLKSGCWLAPLTSPFSMTVIVLAGSKPLPGRTCFRVLRNSSLPSLVWCPNCAREKCHGQ